MTVKIRLDFVECDKDRFYRTFLVDDSMTLVEFGCAVLTSVNASFGGYILVKSKSKKYTPKWFEGNNLLIEESFIADLDCEFEFVYVVDDEEWIFKGIITEVHESIDEEIVLIDGSGGGILEFKFKELLDYFVGNIEPNEIIPFEEDMPYIIETYGEFDSPFNVIKKNENVGNLVNATNNLNSTVARASEMHDARQAEIARLMHRGNKIAAKGYDKIASAVSNVRLTVY